MVKGVMSVIKSQGELIEREKLRAIGMRNKVKAEEENRKIATNELQLTISDKHAELDRYNAELESLLKVENDQKKLIERLSNNEPESSIEE
jgi:intraflagellar transport protein 20